MSTALSAAMLKAYKEGLGVDFALICQGEVKNVHSQVRQNSVKFGFFNMYSQVIMARSPYLEAEVNRWCKEKKELVIEDCDLVTFNVIVDYMYGVAIPDSVLAWAKKKKIWIWASLFTGQFCFAKSAHFQVPENGT